jgi:predicted component of type VI protein secretion system
MQAKLHLVKGNPKGKTVEIPPGTLSVGRAEDSDLIIASTRVSRHHCEIVNDKNRLVIRDKGSGNGTVVNGAKVQEQPLKPGDEVQIGPLTFAVEIDGQRGPGAKPASPPARPAPKAAPRPTPKAAPAAKGAPAPRTGLPPKGKFPVPPGKPAGKDILSSLERLAGGKPRPAAGAPGKKSDDVLEISDQDLLDSDA